MSTENTEYQNHREGGSGSSENVGENRNAQKNEKATVGSDERKDIAEQTGLKPEDIGDIQQTGNLSGRDDAAGGSGDRMEETSDNDATDKF